MTTHVGGGGFVPSLKTVSQEVNAEASFLASEDMTVKRAGATVASGSVAADGSGDKIVLAGTFMTKYTATAAVGKYGPYASGGSNGLGAPSENDSGYLLESINLRDGDVICGILIRGSVLSARVVPVADASIKAAVKGRILFQ